MKELSFAPDIRAVLPTGLLSLYEIAQLDSGIQRTNLKEYHDLFLISNVGDMKEYNYYICCRAALIQDCVGKILHSLLDDVLTILQ